MTLAAFVLAALIAWGSPGFPVTAHDDPALDASGFAGFAWPGLDGGCNIAVGGSWHANPWSQSVIVAHEVGHCLLGQCGYWGHVADEALEYSIMTPSAAIYGVQRDGPLPWDLAFLAATCRQYHAVGIVRVVL